MTDEAKRALSTAVFSLGAIVGLIGCAAVPVTLFTVGQNDSSLSVLLGVPCMILFSPLCILAFWKRRAAGVYFLLLAVMWTSSVFTQYHFEKSRHPVGMSFVDAAGLFICAVFFLLFAAFALMTDHLGWPPLRNPRQSKLKHANG